MDLFDTYGDCAPTIIVLTISSASSLINWLRDCGIAPLLQLATQHPLALLGGASS
jgi:hypothetical protein